MDLSYTPEEQAFRARVREWIAENKPEAGGRDPEELRAWQKRLHAAGFLGAAWPKEHGGAGLSNMEQAILNEELARANAPAPLGSMGISWVGPAILKFGTEEQKQRFVAPLLAGDDIWATGYSEPNAGSDMYNTQTRAVRDGDEYVINGQKVWTSLAHLANWCFLLVRTSSEGHKVAGLSLLLVPMDTPGIEIRPTQMITGESEFSEVFLNDVRVPVELAPRRRGAGLRDRLERAHQRALRHRLGHPLRPQPREADRDRPQLRSHLRPGLAPADRRSRHQDEGHERLRPAGAERPDPRSLQSPHLGRHEVHRDEPHPGLLRGGRRGPGPLRGAARRRRVGRRLVAGAVPLRPLDDHRRGHHRDPAEHHRRADSRAAAPLSRPAGPRGPWRRRGECGLGSGPRETLNAER